MQAALCLDAEVPQKTSESVNQQGAQNSLSPRLSTIVELSLENGIIGQVFFSEREDKVYEFLGPHSNPHFQCFLCDFFYDLTLVLFTLEFQSLLTRQGFPRKKLFGQNRVVNWRASLLILHIYTPIISIFGAKHEERKHY